MSQTKGSTRSICVKADRWRRGVGAGFEQHVKEEEKPEVLRAAWTDGS